MSVLLESVPATANASGIATARLTPLRAFERWIITNTSVSSTSTLISRTDIYIGGDAPTNFHSATFAGNRDSNNDKIELENGTPLIAIWSNCTPGAVCTLTIRGEKVKG